MYRKEGYIAMLKRNSIPHSLMFIDTETYIEEDKLGNIKFPFRLGVIVYVKIDDECNVIEREIHKFTSINAVIPIMSEYLRKRDKLYVFAHNIGFDIRVLYLPTQFKQSGYYSEAPIINERVFIWDVTCNNGSITFLDTANFGVQSVDQLGKDLGFSKLSVKFDTVTDEELFTYCIRDCEILEKFMCSYLHFIHINNLGTFKSTLASQSLTAWRTSLMHQSIYIHNHEPSLKLERDSYHGGRVECFVIGESNDTLIYDLDVNSMYPYIMATEELPYKIVAYKQNPSINDVEQRMENHYVIARVTLQTENNAYPYMEKGKLIFPIGRFDTVLHHRELEYALAHNDIVSVHEASYYWKGQIFNDYVDFFYNIKVESTRNDNKSWRYISKMFMNSLYGKFGQTGVNRIKGKACGDFEVERTVVKPDGSNYRYQVIKWFGETYKETRGGEAYYSNPALAGAITSAARHLLYRYIETAGKDNVLYCDTDSLMVTFDGFKNLSGLVSNDELGLLKLEDTTVSIAIYNAKDYRFGETEHIKGINKNAVRVDKNSWQCTQFASFTSWLNNGGTEGATAKTMLKHRRHEYSKGVIIRDDNNTDGLSRVVPIRLLI